MSWPPTRTVPRDGGMMPARQRKRGGLARAVRADEAEHFAGLEGKGQFVHGGEFAVKFGEAVNLDHGLASGYL